MDLIVNPLPAPLPGMRTSEFAERKGVGHPDTICDALAEELSRALFRTYLDRFGTVLHHNVDKVLLRAGAARPAFGGGEVVEPIDLYLAGRAVREFKGVSVPVDEIAVETSRAWLRRHLHALDVERHVRIHCLVRPGSVELVDLFGGGTEEARANDTSFGVGFAPLTPLEECVLAAERGIQSDIARHPECGEDVKVMGVRLDDRVELTVACAFIGRHVAHVDDYGAKRAALAARVRAHLPHDAEVAVNAADDLAGGHVYLTVTGTSAEAGDDGQVGRGNRVNGLITPYRPMSLEAAAGKNSLSHVGKLYNLAAHRLAGAVVDSIPDVIEAECYLVSQIGAPVGTPAAAEVRVRTADGRPAADVASRVRAIALDHLVEVKSLWKRIQSGELEVF